MGSKLAEKRGYPLASVESLLSLEPATSAVAEVATDMAVEEDLWNTSEFMQLSRRQQNIEIFKVVAAFVMTVNREMSASRHRVDEVVKRLDHVENDSVPHNSSEPLQNHVAHVPQVPGGNGVPGVPGVPGVAGVAGVVNQDIKGEQNFELPPIRPETDTDMLQLDPQGWFFSPRSGTPIMDDDSEPDAVKIAKSRINNPKVIINVGGLKHEVMWKMLERRPRTRLGLLSKAMGHAEILNLVDAYSLVDNEYYFDRDPATFNCVLNFYRTDRLHMIDEVCILDFASDLEFWMIKELNLEICCLDKFNERRAHILAEVEKEKRQEAGEEEIIEDFGDGYFAPYQRALWDLFEKPQSSGGAKAVSLISIGLVLVSTVGMCLNTFEWMQSKDIKGEPVDNPKLALIEAVCISYFTIEYLLRLAGAPQKGAFIKGTMNVIDCLAIAPYYLTLFLLPPPEMEPPDPMVSTVAPEEEEGSGFGNIGRIMQVFRIARIMRIFKLARRSVGLQSIAHTVKTSWKDLGLLFLLVVMGMLVFGSLLYYIENGEPETGFDSIPNGMWWALQTLTSVGYGDFTCTTFLGKVVGSCCGVCGVLVMALPIPIVVDNFADYYSEQKKIEAKELKREAQAKQFEWEAQQAGVAVAGLVDTLTQTPGAFTSPPMSPPTGFLRARQNGILDTKKF